MQHVPFSALSALLLVPIAVAHDGPQLTSVHLVGGPGDQAAHALSAGGDGLVLAGDSGSGAEAYLAAFALPPGPTPEWTTGWPGVAGADAFWGAAAGLDDVFLVGDSYGRTVDTVGGKEGKGITVRFPDDGPVGAGWGGAHWDVQTPPAPGAFTYGGSEWARAVAVDESGATAVYVTGSAQAHGANGGRMWLARLDGSGGLAWAVNDGAVTPYSIGLAVTLLGGDIVVAGTAYDTGVPLATLWRYDPSGAQAWKVSGGSSEYFGVCVLDGEIYAVGRTALDGSADFLVDRWDAAGNLVWSRSHDRDGQPDELRAVLGLHGRLFACGFTAGMTAGGTDAALLELDPASGALLDCDLFGAGLDDRAEAIGTDGQDLYLAGSTRSYELGGNGAGESDALLLRYTVEQGMGDVYCTPAGTNSTGHPAAIAAHGSPYALANHVHLIAADLPAGKPGYFIASETQGFVANPGGSQGNLCLGGAIGRLVDQLEVSDAGGVFAIDLDLEDLPPPAKSLILPGETWSFQAWYRDDNPGPTSNFTPGLEVTFL